MKFKLQDLITVENIFKRNVESRGAIMPDSPLLRDAEKQKAHAQELQFEMDRVWAARGPSRRLFPVVIAEYGRWGVYITIEWEAKNVRFH